MTPDPKMEAIVSALTTLGIGGLMAGAVIMVLWYLLTKYLPEQSARNQGDLERLIVFHREEMLAFRLTMEKDREAIDERLTMMQKSFDERMVLMYKGFEAIIARLEHMDGKLDDIKPEFPRRHIRKDDPAK